MKVYVLTEWSFSDVTNIVAVYVNKEEAEAQMAAELKRDPETRWHGFECEEHDLIGSAS